MSAERNTIKDSWTAYTPQLREVLVREELERAFVAELDPESYEQMLVRKQQAERADDQAALVVIRNDVSKKFGQLQKKGVAPNSGTFTARIKTIAAVSSGNDWFIAHTAYVRESFPQKYVPLNPQG